MVPAKNNVKRLSSVKHTTKTIHYHHHHHHHHHQEQNDRAFSIVEELLLGMFVNINTQVKYPRKHVFVY